MTFPFESDLNYTNQSYIVPEVDDPDFNVKLTQYLKFITIALSHKANSFALNRETIISNDFIPITDPNSSEGLRRRAVYRKVIDFGTLPNSGAKSVPHGIDIRPGFAVINMYAAGNDITNGFTDAVSISQGNPNNALNIALRIDSNNITISTGVDQSSRTICFVTIEYIKEI